MADPIRQLLSQTSYLTDAVTTVWNFSFAGGYIDKAHVKVQLVDSTTGAVTQFPITLGNFIGPFQLSLTPAFPLGSELTIYRDTQKDLPLVDFQDKASITEATLDLNAKQAIFVAAESSDGLNVAINSISLIIGYVDNAQAAADAAAASAAAASSDASFIAANVAAAAASAAAALVSETNADNSEAGALAAASAASSSASTASSAATAASGSATAAATSATNAGNSATAAANSASAAAGSASSASTSAGTATTQAGNAATSATAASGSATAAAGSATAANASAVAAAASAASVVSVPVGGVLGFPGTAAPAGFVKYNGALLSRATYPGLWAYAQASGNLAASDGVWTEGQFSPGDGSTTFRIPDGRGNFFRGLDDGRGVDTGRAIGSSQASANLAHNHGVSDPTHGHGISDPTHQHGSAAAPAGAQVLAPGSVGAAANGGATAAAATGVSVIAGPTGITIQSNGGTEARPRNLALLMCIKY